MQILHNYSSYICNKAKLTMSRMIIVNNFSFVKYKVIDASARFFILEAISEDGSYGGTLICVRPDQFLENFHFEGD